MGLNSFRSIRSICLAMLTLVGIGLAGSSASAQTYNWTGFISNSWANDANWLPNPGFNAEAAPTANFGAQAFDNLSTTLNGSRTLTGITVGLASGNVSIAPGTGGTLTIGTGGINMSTAAVNLSVSTPISTSASQSWNVAASRLLTVSGTVALNTGHTLTVTGDGNTTVSGLISGDGGLQKGGLGVLTLSNTANSFSGLVTITGGRIDAASIDNAGVASSLGAGSGIVFSGGTLRYTSASTASTDRSIVLGASGGTIDFSVGNTTLNLTGAISGTGRLNLGGITGGGSLFTLSGDNTGRTGGTSINGTYVLQIDSDTRLGAVPGSPTANNIVLSSGTLRATNTFAIDSNRGIQIAGSGTIDVVAGPTLTVGGVISGAELFKRGPGTLVLSGTNTYTGRTRVDDGTLSISSEANLGQAPAIFDAGHLVVSGGATLQTTADVSLNANRGLRLGSPVSSGGNSTFDVAAGTTLTVNTPVAQFGSAHTLVKSGAGTMVLNGASTSTYTGGTSVTAGTLRITQPNALPAGGALTLANNTTFSTGTGNGSQMGDLTLSGNVLFELGSANHNLEFAGLTASGSLAVTGWTGFSGTGGRMTFSNIGSDPNATYASYLSSVQFDGYTAGGQFVVNGGGYELVPVPEPGTMLGVSALTLSLVSAIRRTRRQSK